MDHAWLDSLSEDWVSQPPSDESSIGHRRQPSDENRRPRSTQVKGHASRIPRPTGAHPSSSPSKHDGAAKVLAERSPSYMNISASLCGAPKQHKQPSEPTRGKGRSASRSVSSGTNCSVIHNTVHQRSPSVSPSKAKEETPEWKRRLVYGDLAYGEQRDLFCSAAVGLEDIFKPPPPPNDEDPSDDDPFFEGYSQRNETTLPSSPPLFRAPPPLEEGDFFDDRPADETPSPSPRRSTLEAEYGIAEDSMLRRGPNGFTIHQDGDHGEQEDAGSHDHSVLPSEPPHIALQPPEGESRKVSGQSVVQNEDFSPIYLTKHSSGDGKLDFTPMELPADQLHARLENLRIHQMLIDSRPEDSLALDSSTNTNGNLDNTEDYMRRGGFLNLKRGGRSAEDSFRHRLLSPSLGNSSEMLQEESLQASTPKQFPTVRNSLRPHDTPLNRSPQIPRAPYPSPEKRQHHLQPSAGSPLKLFGPYDTFTNQTLMRRISQFEDQMSRSPSRQLSRGESLGSRSEDGSARNSWDPSETRTQPLGRFGDGDLEGYEFDGEGSGLSMDQFTGLDSISNVSEQENIPPDFHASHNSSPSDASQLVIHRRRRKSSLESQAASTTRNNFSSVGPQGHGNTPKRDCASDGKRPSTSPSKGPTPKRRRTLHESDVAYGREDDLENVDWVQDSHQKMQAALGKKGKEARSPGDFQRLTNPDVLAHRQILRPRTPTPSQRSSLMRQTNSTVDERPSSKRSPLRSTLSTGAAPAGSSVQTDRKPSIKTQDFLNEAAQIMAMIRDQVRPPPQLSSVEESEEHGIPVSELSEEDSFQESTQEPFSRPPSRDGAPLTRMPTRQSDPDIIDRLKKYQELSDMGDIVTSSVRSMGLAKEAIRAAQDVERQIRTGTYQRTSLTDMPEDEEFSDPPNIRIIRGSADSGATTGVIYPSTSSQGSTTRSIPTVSSRTSETKRTIAPQSVSHLIPDQVGSMYLDRDKKVWVKKKGQAADAFNVLPSEETEDDPFASIPDLSVDLTMEIRNLKIATAKKEQAAVDPEDIPSPDSPLGIPPAHKMGYVTLSPGAIIDEEAVLRAKYELTKLEARASASPVRVEDEVEHEITINEGRDRGHPSRRRNLTISFSSPVASIIRDVLPEDLNYMSEDSDYAPEVQPGEDDSSKRATSTGGGMAKPAATPGPRKGSRGQGRQASFAGVAFVPRPVSRIDERDEDSGDGVRDRQLSFLGESSIVGHATATPDNRRTSISFLFTARNPTEGEAGDASAIINHNVGNLSLSPISEFTMNNADHSYGLEISYLHKERRLVTGNGSKKVMSQALRELVERLTEVEPSEPFWDSLGALDLQDKRLTSLHMLDEFCGRLVSLDASSNALNHLDGVPLSVRQLRVSHNLLTELTSWDHLTNLQYIDVSNNDLRSLSGLKNLVHLRSIKADNNLITSLDGIDELDGLLSLRARNNLIEYVDFEGTRLERLSELDLNGNKITSVANLDKLASLSTLKLQRNELEGLSCRRKSQSLRYLDVSDNRLATLDLSHFPKLRLLHADRNHLAEVTGFAQVRHLDSLSLREQRGPSPLDTSFLSAAYEVRKLFLSGNYIQRLVLPVDMLNLQLLEVAECGLTELPARLGQLAPNLRALNANFNAVADLEPLRFVPRMKRLLVAGNRLADSTRVTELLTDFPHLTELDLRDNPITLGFYPPSQVLVTSTGEMGADGFGLPRADAERDALFASRLDEATRLRRRLYQVVFAGCCRKLKVLDGLAVKRTTLLAKDEVFETLVREGLLPGDEVEEQVEKQVEADGPGAEEVEHTTPVSQPEAEGGLEGELSAEGEGQGR